MEKVTLQITGNIYNMYSAKGSIYSLRGMELTGTPKQVGLLYFRMIGLSNDFSIQAEDNPENLEVLHKCYDAIQGKG